MIMVDISGRPHQLVAPTVPDCRDNSAAAKVNVGIAESTMHDPPKARLSFGCGISALIERMSVK